MQMILNDLSVKFPVSSVEEGKQIMNEFINTFQTVKKIITNDSLLLDRDYNSFELASGYRIEQWRNDPSVDLEVRRKFRRILNQSATYNSEEFDMNYNYIFTSEFQYRRESSKGCLVAYMSDGVVLSFLSDEAWKESFIKGELIAIDDDGNIESCIAEVPNVSCEQNIDNFKIYYSKLEKEFRYTGIISGEDIVRCASQKFPNLVFCDHAIRGCKRDVGVSEAGQVYRRLLELQNAAKSMDNYFNKESLTHATPETNATLERFSEEHTFKLPNGNTQLFSWHVRYTGGYAGRIFFHPVASEKKIYIGHVGQKLPTVMYH